MASSSFDALIGTTPEMRAVIDQLSAIANTHGTILLRGEDGTGRRTLARAIHDDTHAKQPFVVVDIAGASPALVASTLFGYEVSTFVAGLKVTRGAFETAESGTILLREVAAIPRELQPVLAETLHTHRYMRVGADAQHAFTPRLISTTHTDLDRLVAAGHFDPGLYRALTVDGAVTVPPLRDRLADLPALVARFARRTLDPALVARLANLPWPGNVGELRRAVAALVANHDAITELELLAAIVADPDDDGPRLVYGDLLAARNDPRGELVQIQCRLADRQADPLHRLQTAERKLLEAHQVEWTGAVVTAGATPTYTPEVTLRRGFVEHVDTSVHILRNLEAIFRVAPLLESLALYGVPKPELLFSPLLRRIRALRITVGSFSRPEVSALATCPYLTSLQSLTLLPNLGAIEDRAPWLGLAPQAEPPTREAGARILSTSPHLANVRTLVLDGLELGEGAAAILLNKNATWRLEHLSLAACELDGAAIETLVEAVHAPHLRSLDLRRNPIGAAGALALSSAKSLSSLTTLHLDAVESNRAQIALRASRALANVAIYLDGELLVR